MCLQQRGTSELRKSIMESRVWLKKIAVCGGLNTFLCYSSIIIKNLFIDLFIVTVIPSASKHSCIIVNKVLLHSTIIIDDLDAF